MRQFVESGRAGGEAAASLSQGHCSGSKSRMLQTILPPTRRLRACLALILLLGAGLRLYRLDVQSAWIDELCRVLWAKGYEPDRWFGFLPSETSSRQPPKKLKSALPVVNAHNAPLNSILLNTWMRVIGSESDLALRLPVASLSTASILGTYLAAAEVVGPVAGLWAAALVALSPFHVFYAQEIKDYGLCTCLVSFALWFFFRWLRRSRRADGIGLALAGTAAVYTHYFAGLLLALLGLEILRRFWRHPRRLAFFALPHVAILAAFAPYLRTLRGQLSEMTSGEMTGTFKGAAIFWERLRTIPAVPWLGERGEYLPAWEGLPIGILTVTLFIWGLRSISDRETRRMLLLTGAGPLVLVIGLFWLVKSNNILWARYQLFFTFVQFIPIAVALRQGVLRSWLAAAALMVLAGIGLRFIYFEMVKEDWKDASAAIASHGSPQESVVVYQPVLTNALARYLSTENRLFGIEEGPELPRALALATEGRSASWFVSAWASSNNVPAAVHTFLGCRYARREDFPVPPGRVGMTVTRYSEPRSSAGETTAPATRPPCAKDDANSGPSPWESAIAGPTVEQGNIEAPAPSERIGNPCSLTVAGWAFSSRGIRDLLFEIDSIEMLRTRHVGLPRPDVAAGYPAVPSGHTLHAGFWAVVDLASVRAGRHSLTLMAEHPDGSVGRIASTEFINVPSSCSFQRGSAR